MEYKIKTIYSVRISNIFLFVLFVYNIEVEPKSSKYVGMVVLSWLNPQNHKHRQTLKDLPRKNECQWK